MKPIRACIDTSDSQLSTAYTLPERLQLYIHAETEDDHTDLLSVLALLACAPPYINACNTDASYDLPVYRRARTSLPTSYHIPQNAHTEKRLADGELCNLAGARWEVYLLVASLFNDIQSDIRLTNYTISHCKKMDGDENK